MYLMPPLRDLSVAEKRSTILEYDYMILIPVILLVGLGLMVAYSASSHLAELRCGDRFFYLKRHVLFCILGFGLMIIAKNIPCAIYSKQVYPLIFISFCLLLLTLVPGFGHKVGGACRWFRLWEGITFQPSEIAKISLAIYSLLHVYK